MNNRHHFSEGIYSGTIYVQVEISPTQSYLVYFCKYKKKMVLDVYDAYTEPQRSDMVEPATAEDFLKTIPSDTYLGDERIDSIIDSLICKYGMVIKTRSVYDVRTEKGVTFHFNTKEQAEHFIISRSIAEPILIIAEKLGLDERDVFKAIMELKR